jgi:glutathione synthase/RimK-type ligase-like ATP-grasp enzyme
MEFTWDITLLTDKRWVNVKDPDWYAQQILDEDGLVQAALEKLGLKVHRTYWDDPEMDWTSTRFAMFRTTWDYFDHFGRFSQWLEETSELTRFLNPYSQVRWNMDKHYLVDLAARNIPIPPTLFIEAGDPHSLQKHLTDSGWERAVLKPAVSGAGRHTYLLDTLNVDSLNGIYKELIGKESMLLQEFQEAIVTQGEAALMVIGGTFTHAILKRARSGDFRVQDDFGGTVESYKPSDDLIALAERIVTACDPLPSYARVDIMWGSDGEPMLSELELIEPEMWFRFFLSAADQLANYLVKTYFS